MLIARLMAIHTYAQHHTQSCWRI